MLCASHLFYAPDLLRPPTESEPYPGDLQRTDNGKGKNRVLAKKKLNDTIHWKLTVWKTCILFKQSQGFTEVLFKKIFKWNRNNSVTFWIFVYATMIEYLDFSRFDLQLSDNGPLFLESFLHLEFKAKPYLIELNRLFIILQSTVFTLEIWVPAQICLLLKYKNHSAS